MALNLMTVNCVLLFALSGSLLALMQSHGGTGAGAFYDYGHERVRGRGQVDYQPGNSPEVQE